MAPYLPWFLGGPSASSRAALSAFLALDPSAQAKIKEAVRNTDYPYNRKRLTEKARILHETLKVLDADTLFAILDLITDLVEISPKVLPDVLAQIFADIGSSPGPFEAVIRDLASDTRLTHQRAIEEFKGLAVPSLRPIEYVCAIKTRFDKKFSYAEDSIENYNPKIADNHPVAIVNLRLIGSDERLTFQLDQERLDRLISELIAAQRELKILVDHVRNG